MVIEVLVLTVKVQTLVQWKNLKHSQNVKTEFALTMNLVFCKAATIQTKSNVII